MLSHPLPSGCGLLQECIPFCPSSPATRAAKPRPSLVCYAQPPRPPRPPRLIVKEDSLSISDSSSSSSSSSHLGHSDQGTGMASAFSPKEIMQLIKTTDSSQEVLQIVCQMHSCFNVINTATALHKTARLMRPSSRQAAMHHPGMTVLLGHAEAQHLLSKGRQRGMPCGPWPRCSKAPQRDCSAG